MDVQVVTADQESFRVQFSDAASGIKFIVGLSMPTLAKWKMQSHQLLSTVTILADEILINHDQSQPLKPEYLFTNDNTQATLEATLEQIRATPL